jgi:hypothetical protein
MRSAVSITVIAVAMYVGLIVTLALGAEPSAPASPAPSVWPLEIASPAWKIEIYQPQPESLAGDMLDARAAVSLTKPGETEPVFGAMWLKARVATDRDERTVTIRDIDVQDVRLPNATKEQEQQFVQAIKDQVPRLDVTFSLDQLMTSLDLARKEQVEAQQLETKPPKIIFSTVPATLVTIDGTPKLQPTDASGGANVMRVVNTPFVILLDPDSRRYFLKAGGAWVSASDVMGPWEDAANVPPTVEEAAAKLSQSPSAASSTAPAQPAPPPSTTQPLAPPKIIVATEPTELIVTNGAPTYTPLPGNDLLYVGNTESNVFLDVPSQRTYVLLAGRWYRAQSTAGPWEYVSADKLPAAFAKIPADSPKAGVLAFVAGTTEAHEAVLDASIPQTAAIRRDAGQSLNITYDGEPKFQPIENTPMSYAANTSDAIILVNGIYYCCHDAVWYQGPSPNGPWTVCTSVPPAIYTIPPSCPIYNCRYVYVYDSTPDVVYCGYLPGYTGCYVYGPTVVYGTGYWYPGWYGATYVARPWTWGVGAYFDPWNDTWGFGLGYVWGSTWFAHDHHWHGWWGPGHFRDWHEFRDRQFEAAERVNVYSRAENFHRNIFADRHSPIRIIAGGEHNDVFAGHDGRVYRRTANGWEAHDEHGWSRLNAVPEARPIEPRVENPAPRAGDNPCARSTSRADRARAGIQPLLRPGGRPLRPRARRLPRWWPRRISRWRRRRIPRWRWRGRGRGA